MTELDVLLLIDEKLNDVSAALQYQQSSNMALWLIVFFLLIFFAVKYGLQIARYLIRTFTRFVSGGI
jgi:nitrogen fixation/metabolism regulation signal transduction histidine kinase